MSDAEKKALDEKAQPLLLKALQAKDWKGIWTIPAGAAAIVMVIFFVLFKDDRKRTESEGAPHAQPETGSTVG